MNNQDQIKEVNIPQDKKEDAVQTATSSIVESLRQNFSEDQIDDIVNQLSSNNPDTTTSRLNTNIQEKVSNDLTQKTGLSRKDAIGLAAVLTPVVIRMFSRKINDGSDPNFNLQSMMGAFKGSTHSGISGVLGKMFTKR
ncbi:MAG: DUF937 domain-containing protein [Odoribacter sp.]|nr:DUF937 domain-containing protein [Odoribacter sp.]